MGDIGVGEVHHLTGDTLVGIFTRTNAFLLEERVNLTLEETTLLVNLYLDNGRVGGDTCETHTIRGTEITEAVGNEASFIDFGGTDDMRSMTIDDVCSVVDAEMGELAKRASVFTQETLGTLRQMVFGTSFSTAMEGDNDDI